MDYVSFQCKQIKCVICGALLDNDKQKIIHERLCCALAVMCHERGPNSILWQDEHSVRKGQVSMEAQQQPSIKTDSMDPVQQGLDLWIQQLELLPGAEWTTWREHVQLVRLQETLAVPPLLKKIKLFLVANIFMIYSRLTFK